MELSEEEVRGLRFKCNNFLQSWEMYQRYQNLGRESYFMGVKNTEGEIVAAGLMLARPWKFGLKVFRVPGGWLMDYDGLFERPTSSNSPVRSHRTMSTAPLRASNSPRSSSQKAPSLGVLEFITLKAKEFVKKKGGIALEIAPNIVSQPRDAHNEIVEGRDNLGVKRELVRLGYKYLGEYEQVKWTFVKDLESPESAGLSGSATKERNADLEEMFMAFRTDHRQRIRRAEREKVRVRELGNGELGILKQIAAEAGERHGFRDPEMEYYRSMKEAFGEKVKFIVAEVPAERLPETEREGLGSGVEYVPLAAAMFVIDDKEIVYLYSGSVRKLQKYGGAHLMQWKMIQEAVEKGCEKYNFYGVRPVEGDGVYNFKLGFRGKVEELLGTFILPIGVMGKMYAARLPVREYGEVK